ncbi:MAG: hypothetical protein KF861_19370, partial [Planctomycetaceae bacterium]|nr:hypothetical protein [Planctomycetaceae bacterium]
SLPRVRPKRFAGALLLPLVFAVGACFVPLRELVADASLRSTAGQQATSELQQMLQALEEADVLDEREQESLREAIEKLREETEQSPLTHEKWETVDSLAQRMQMKLDASSVEMSQAAHATALLAKAAAGDGQSLSAERVAALEQDVLETLQKMMKSGNLPGGSASLNDELKRLMKNGDLRLPQDAEAREKLLNELQDFLEQESAKLSELREQCQGSCSKCGSKTCDGSECKEGECKECGAECQGGLCSTCSGNRPGRGGITRGRGDAELTWGDESDLAGTKFKETVLPPGMQDMPKDDVLSVTQSAPEVDPAMSAPRAAARSVDPAAGRETWNRTLRPRHRDAVRQYFDAATRE